MYRTAAAVEIEPLPKLSWLCRLGLHHWVPFRRATFCVFIDRCQREGCTATKEWLAH